MRPTLRASLDKIASLRASLLDQQVATALTVRGMLSADQLAAAAAAPPPERPLWTPPPDALTPNRAPLPEQRAP
jgi:hypothetical protein